MNSLKTRLLVFLLSGSPGHKLPNERGESNVLFSPAGFEPTARSFDRALVGCLRRGDFHALLRLDPRGRDLAAEDAIDSVLVAAAAVDWLGTGHEVLSYEGPFGVGYGVAVLFDAALSGNGGTKGRAQGQTSPLCL